MKSVFVDVILPLPLNGTFTYRADEHAAYLAVGKRVLVNFGRNKFYSALIIAIHNQKPDIVHIKSVVSILDDLPIVTEKQIKLWQWIADYYMSSLGEVMLAALPSAFRLSSETKVALHPDFDGDLTNLNPQELLVIETLSKKQSIDLNKLCSLLGNTYAMTQINNMVDKSLIYICEEVEEKFKPRNDTFISFSERYVNNEQLFSELLNSMERKKNTQQQANVILQLILLQQKNKEKFIKKTELLQQKSVTESRISSLIKKGIFVALSLPVSRLKNVKNKNNPEDIFLSSSQETALHSIQEYLKKNKTVLLHGVTGSGKTEIYIKLIHEVIQQKKQVLYLLPEIALTEQIINRLRNYFGEKVGIYHSHYNSLQRAEIWKNLLEKKQDSYQIILGTRSSIFLPFNNLGLIIIDEEHDSSYKQYDPAPRYNARDTAAVLAKIHNACCLLGSATPSLESFSNTQSGKYSYVPLMERYGGLQMPNIELVDIRKAKFQQKMKSHFSQVLLDNINHALLNDKQIILFQNRRGFAPHVECSICGYIPHCQHCDVTLTYHKSQHVLRCHYCGFQRQLPSICPQCNHSEMEMKGFGTEKIEEDLQALFPHAKISRLDYDSTRNKNSFQQIIHNFEIGKIDILVGTQMVTKGLDFDRVSLVGVLNADNMLNYPDFRSFERAFQLLMQVSGRAGRKNQQGKVIIQTQNPQHDIFKYIQNNDYQDFFLRLMRERQHFFYPPYTRLLKISIQHKENNILDKIASEFANLLKKNLNIPIFGPEYALIPKVRNVFRKELLIKLPIDNQMGKNKQKIGLIINQFKQTKGFSNAQIIVDVDTY